MIENVKCKTFFSSFSFSRKVKKRNSLRTQRNENVKLMIENGKYWINGTNGTVGTSNNVKLMMENVKCKTLLLLIGF